MVFYYQKIGERNWNYIGMGEGSEALQGVLLRYLERD